MKRRSFIGMLGAAVTAPALPMAAPNLTPQIKALMATHVKKYPVITVLGISNRIGVPIEEAKVLLHELSRQGVVGQVHNGTHVYMRARSHVYEPSQAAVKALEARRRLEAQHGPRRETLRSKRRYAISHDWLAHLRGICEKNDIPLQPRALEYAV